MMDRSLYMVSFYCQFCDAKALDCSCTSACSCDVGGCDLQVGWEALTDGRTA